MKISTIDDLNHFLLEAIEICKYEIKKCYECGQGKQHPDYNNLTCSLWVYEKLLERVVITCDEDITENNCDNVSTGKTNENILC